MHNFLSRNEHESFDSFHHKKDRIMHKFECKYFKKLHLYENV